MSELKRKAMIECTKCNRWFHVDCEVVLRDILDNSEAVINYLIDLCNNTIVTLLQPPPHDHQSIRFMHGSS